ncbi:MAG: NmrA family NAD(P)-binding protein [Azospirillaceae bacterium]|nr:NmrA family NAD(P)-binding protein [Azospirillaceae bacterium]
MRYIVTGVDGQLGGRVAENMLATVDGSQLIFTSPDLALIPAEKQAAWRARGVTIRTVSYDDRAGLTEVFREGDRLWMISGVLVGLPRQIQHRNVIDAAVDAGIKHLTYTSFLGADRQGYGQYVMPDHTFTEAYLRNSGLTFNIMRNNLYLENYFTTSVMLALQSGNKWYTTAGEGRGSFIAKDDSARVAAALLLGRGQPNAAYDVTGEMISQREICSMVGAYSGISFEYCPVDDETFYRYLDGMHIPRSTEGDYSRSPVRWCSNDMVTNEASIGYGQMAIITDTVEKLTGRKPTPPRELLQRYAYVWKDRV